MDVLNLKKQLTSQTSSEIMCGGVIKMEPEDELDKENCEDEDYVTDLTMTDNRDESNDRSSENIKEEVFETEIMEEDEEEVENPDLPVFSVIVKEENRNSAPRDPLRENELPRSRVEIKYEDDIEEEEYDSDEEQSEMGSVINMSTKERDTPINFVNVNGRLLPNNSPGNVAYRSCFNPDYFDSSIVSFQIGSQIERNGMSFDDTELDGDSQDKNDKSSDSILLSIVYATINVPFSQVSKFLTAYNLSKSQLSVIRKVRRQVKNRLYAQNCRRRRVAHIKNLANELQQIKVEKEKLCNVKNDLTAKMLNLEDRYKQLYSYVMNALAERYRNEDFDFTDSNMNENTEETRIQKRKLAEEYVKLENKKQKLEQKYDHLYKHVFKIIEARNQNNGMARNGMDSNIDFKLCHMDIVNELAMLNKYWSKNNLKPNEQMDFESSISVDGSRTSENKLNDFVDFESSLSVDGSRTEENKLNDFIDYESSVDGSIHSENKRENRNSNPPNASTRGSNVEENSRMSDSSLIVWSEDENESEDDNQDEEDELEERLDELQKIGDELYLKKINIQERYEKLYGHVIKAMEISETEFLKVFMDYCIRLLKTPPERSTSSVEFDGS